MQLVRRKFQRLGLRQSLFVLMMSLFVTAQTQAAGIVYRVAQANDDAIVGYLVGTVHSDDPRILALMETIEPLVAEVDIVAIELIPDAVTMLAVGAASVLPGGQRLSSIIGKERFDALSVAARKLDIPTDALDRMQPWAAAVMLEVPSAEAGRFFDMEIYLSARQHEKRAVGLESAAEQLAVFSDMPRDLQLVMLDEAIKNADQMPLQIESLLQASLDGDLDRLDREARAHYAGLPAEIVAWMTKHLIDDRNARMLERMRPLLEQGKVLVAVGALHLSGESGLVAGLRGLGFIVEPAARAPR